VELVVFGARRTSACLFPRIFISILLPSNYVPIFGLARYDFVFVGAVLAQVALVALKVETRDEALTLLAFHLCSASCWRSSRPTPPWGRSYPQEGFLEA
jgi:uncharacterized membrane protein YoaT (DUF817 family)